VPLTPAILNAIFDAVGVRVYTLPVRPSRIRADLKRRTVSGQQHSCGTSA